MIIKRLIILSVLFNNILIICYSQVPAKTYSVEFILHSSSIHSDSAIYVCGNLPQLATWNPGKIKMTPVGNHTWTFRIQTDAAFPIEYKYTLGSWEREGATSNGTPLSNFIIKVKSDTTINDNVLSWTDRSKRRVQGQITGKLEYHKQMGGEGLKERDVIVWLPPDYEKNSGKKYPVIYMQDGQNLFDPATSAFGADWQIDETCDSLIRNGVIGSVIVVGIYNTSDRMLEYTPGTKGEAYMDFVINIVKPFIDNIYPTLPDRKNTYVGGSSAGATISFMLAWNHPEVFSAAFCLSPAFKIQNIDLVKDVSSYKGKKKKITLYIDNGGKGLDERLQPGVDEMLKALQEKGFRPGKDYYWLLAPDAEHNESAWAKRIPEALKIILNR